LKRYQKLKVCLFLFLSTMMVILPFKSLANASTEKENILLKISDENLALCIISALNKTASAKASGLKKLKCHGKKITNLKGIEQLHALEQLSLYNNKLQHADVSSLMQLKGLNIANNKLKTINISKLSQLESLYLFRNKLQHVDFTGLTKLTKIRITNNQLVDIDISPLISLEKAYFFDNKLEDLSLTGLIKLSFLEVRQNPMPDEVYDRYDEIDGITIIHDGNADDWK